MERKTTSSTVLCMQISTSSYFVAYSLVNTLSREFRDRMYACMAVAVSQGGCALSALRAFLQLYQITEDEYDIGSAYRNWLRHKEKALNPTAPVLKQPKKREPTSGQLSLF